MIADVNYTVAGFPMNPSVVFTRCRFPLHLPIFADHALIFSLAKCEFCAISFPRGGCVCSWLRVSAELGSATAKHGKACLQPYGAKADSIESVCSICLLHQGTPARQNKLRMAKTN